MWAFQSNDVNTIYDSMINTIIEKGTIISPRNMMTKELSPVIVELTNIEHNVVTLQGAKLNLKYAKKELEWYISGSNEIKDLGEFAKIWEKFSDDGIHANSAYGYLIKGSDPKIGINQSNWCIKKLNEDKDSRQCVININMPFHKWAPTKNFPCTIAIQLLLRNNKLNWFTFMRSNDAYFGFRNDIYCFTELQKRLSETLNVENGAYTHWATSMHLYEPQIKKLQEAIKNW